MRKRGWRPRSRVRVPVVHQMTRTDCGLACLAMVLGFHGRPETLSSLRQRVPGSTAEVTMRTLVRGAAEYGLSSRAVRARLSQLNCLKLPAVLHWDFNHFVVLEEVTESAAIIVDPANGRERVPLDEVSEHFTGIALEFWVASPLKQGGGVLKASLSDLWSNAKGFRSSAVLVLAVGAGVQVLLLLVPLLLSVAIDRIGAFQSDQLIMATAVVAISAVIISTFGDVVRRMLLIKLGIDLNQQIGLNFVNHLLRLPYRFFQERRLNDLMSRVDSIRQIKDTLVNETAPVLIDGFFSVAAIAAIAAFSPRLAMVSLTCAAAYAALRIVAYPVQRRRSDRTIDAVSSERGSLMETVRAIQTIKVLGAELARISSWHGANAKANAAMRRQQELLGALQGGRALISGIDLLLVVLLAMAAVQSREMSMGALFALVAIRQQFQDRAYGLVDRAFEFGMIRLHLDRLSDVTLAAPERGHQERSGHIAVVSDGALTLEGVGFRYAEDGPWIIRDVSFHVRPNEFVAITGPSGGGKTTLARMLLGLLPPTEGKILVDGVPLGGASVEAYRGSIAAVLQEDQLFSGTLIENIAGLEPDIDIDRVKSAASAADIHEDIMRMNAGYYSRVGDMGSTLSGGQKQRVLIARALYRRPRILFLDEGTANLDMERELKIVDQLAKLGVTLICIAHRSATLVRADRVLELRDGCVTELQRSARAVKPLNA